MHDLNIKLVTGASGYVGGRLARKLAKSGASLRVMARRPEMLPSIFHDTADVVGADVLCPETLGEALSGVTTAYYLIHSLGDKSGFEEREAEGAENFLAAAEAAGVRRIVYLGGLCPADEVHSAHMRSRLNVGRILRSGTIPVVEFRASIIIGAGSLSFELVRSLVERLPIMLTPRWVRVKSQPIAIDDVLTYLQEAADIPLEESTVFEIGTSERVTYGDLMRLYAEERGLKRLFVPVPVLTPYLSSLWLGLVTPIFARIGRRLVESITVPSVVESPVPPGIFSVEPMDVRAAIGKTMRDEDRQFVDTHWAGANSVIPTRAMRTPVRYGRRLFDCREKVSSASPSDVFQSVAAIGGNRGWYYANFLWTLRGLLDRLVGGVGMKRGRRHPSEVDVGDVIDCWRVEAVDPGSRLLLQAEMKLPGRAWLQFEVKPDPAGSRTTQTAIYDPRGLAGLLYWYSVYPLHGLVFEGMLGNLLADAEERSAMRKEMASPVSARS